MNLLFEEVLKELLTESIASRDIISAMNNREVIAINYEGDDVKSGYRYIEIYAYGETLGGNPCVLALMRGNVVSKTIFNKRPNDKVHWRIYRLDRIKNWNRTKKKYGDHKMNLSSEKSTYNEAYKNMKKVYHKVPFTN